MTTVIINEKTVKGRLIIDLIQEFGVGEIIEDRLDFDRIFNYTSLRTINEAKEGNTIKCNDFDDYINKVK